MWADFVGVLSPFKPLRKHNQEARLALCVQLLRNLLPLNFLPLSPVRIPDSHHILPKPPCNTICATLVQVRLKTFELIKLVSLHVPIRR